MTGRREPSTVFGAAAQEPLASRPGPVRAYLPVAVAVVVLGAIPPIAGGSGYLISVATLMVVLICYGIGFNVVFGGTGQLMLSIGALAAVAAYTSALLGGELGWPVVVTLPVGVVGATVIGVLLSWIAVRRRLDTIFFGVVTLTASLVVHNLLLGQRELTGGETGLLVEGGADSVLRHPAVGYYLALAVLAVGLASHRAIQRSALGWAFRAVRDDPVAAEFAGVDVARTKMAAAAFGSALVGTAGSVYAHVDGFISPTTYGFATVDVRVMVVVVLGGLGTLLGPVVGGVVVTLLDEVLRPLGQLRVAAYGGLLLVAFLGLPRGVLPTGRALWRRWRPQRSDRVERRRSG